MSCHAALLAPFGPSMFVPAGEERRVRGRRAGTSRPTANGAGRRWGWRAATRSSTPRSRARSSCSRRDFGSDPKLADEACATLADTCLKCHGAMGKRQFDIDHPGASAKFSLDHVQRSPVPTGTRATATPSTARWPATASAAWSATGCSREPQPPDDHRPYLQYFLETSITGNFHLGPPGEIYGPFEDDEIAPYAMEHATGLKPKHGEFLKSSQLCGTCHTVVLPTVDRPRDASDPDHRRRVAQVRGRPAVPQVPPPRRAGDLPGVAQQRVRERDQRDEPEGPVVPGLPHGARAEGRAARASTSRRSRRGSRRSRTRPIPTPRTSPRTTGSTSASATRATGGTTSPG